MAVEELFFDKFEDFFSLAKYFSDSFKRHFLLAACQFHVHGDYFRKVPSRNILVKSTTETLEYCKISVETLTTTTLFDLNDVVLVSSLLTLKQIAYILLVLPWLNLNC